MLEIDWVYVPSQVGPISESIVQGLSDHANLYLRTTSEITRSKLLQTSENTSI
jgi:hypothetical protein